MAQPQLLQIKLSRFDAQPWGFRLQGGVDFAAPLLVQKVNAGSLAEKAGLIPGDAVIKINDVDVFNLRHKDAQDIVVRSGNNFVITVQRGGSTWRPHVTPTGHIPQPNQNSPYLQTVTKTSLAHRQQESEHIGCGYNNSARPFANGGDGSVKSIVNKQYNTPVGIYSDESIAETLSAQAEVLAGGVLGVNFKKNEKEYQADKSEVLKFLREEETGQSSPAFSSHQYQEQQQYQQPQQQSTTRHVNAPINAPKPPSTGGLPVGQNICNECERLITGVFVRIKDKNLHVECFKCATCGTSLKNQGYYNFNNKLYCDIHAKLAAMQNPPPGTEGYVPVPIKPNTKLSANTVSSALSAHGFNDIPVANGNSTPAAAPCEDICELPLPPPPSPTQLQQFESASSQEACNTPSSQTSTRSSNSSLSVGSSNVSNLFSTGALGRGGDPCGGGVSISTSLTPSLDSLASPLHSRQTSSCSSLDTRGGNDLPPPPPPPPPMPEALRADSCMSPKKRLNNGNTKIAQQHLVRQHQNENDMNTQNQNVVGEVGGMSQPQLASNAYNKLLKEYSNKLLTQNNSGNVNNNSHHTTHLNSNRRFNETAKPYQSSSINAPLPHTSEPTTNATNVAAVSPSLANQLKFNPCQVANSAAANNAVIANNTKTNSNTITSQDTDRNENISATMLTEPTSASDQPFGEYVTLTGNVIRSVVPPGKGVNINYKVNQGYARPYGTAGAPAAAPKSPVSYPPQPQQWAGPPKPAASPYATLPRTNFGQQGRRVHTSSNYGNNYSTQYRPPTATTARPHKYATMPSYNSSHYNDYYNRDSNASLQPQYAEECVCEAPAGAAYFEEDYEVAEANRQSRLHFSWPPPQDDSHTTPTAAPLYIAPPETQHVVAKPGKPQPVEQQQPATSLQPEVAQPHWQSYSAPQLTIAPQPAEIESSSESFTSTATTTTTTSEEYQRMYAAQVQAYQMQQAYEQSSSELDYHMDMEIATMQQVQQDESFHSSVECTSGRRSAQECVETLVVPLSTHKLIDMVREVTPSPIPQQSSQGPRHVVFADEPQTKEVSVVQTELLSRSESPADETSRVVFISNSEVNNETSQGTEYKQETYAESQQQAQEDILIREDRTNILESQRLFQPTPEIKFEIAPVRQIPPTKIPNPVPKEWINPMIRALTTASDVPFHMVDCPCPKPCDCNFETEPQSVAQPKTEPGQQKPLPSKDEENPSRGHETPKFLNEEPPYGSKLASAMSTAPEFTVHFAPAASETIPLPEETEPYMPPPIDMKPYMREDYRPKSPFLSALTTAPEKPFEGHFERDVPIHLLDLPTPKEHLTLSDALRTASERSYTPLNPENATHMFEAQEKEKERKKYEFQVLDRDKDIVSNEPPEYFTTEKINASQRKPSAFAAMQAFQPSREPLTPGPPRNSVISLSKEEPDPEYVNFYKAKERNQKRLDYFHKKEEELQQQTTQTNTCQASSLSSYTKETSSFESSSAAQQLSTTSTYDSDSTQASRFLHPDTHSTIVSSTNTQIDIHEIVEETAEELEHSEVLFPPPSPLSHLKGKTVSSGLHKADTIPKYQRNWTALPSQSPIRTPEPQELRENVPLAFVDAPKTPNAVVSSASNPVYRPVAQMTTSSSSQQQQTATAACGSKTSIASVSHTQQKGTELSRQQQPTFQQSQSQPQKLVKPPVPIIIEDRSGPVTMAFQPLDEHMQRDESQTPSRPYTPSLANKPAPIIPFYQTPEKLCFDECPATHARAYDRRSASPFPDRARSPAPGPPPNPLSAIRAPRMKDNELSPMSPRVLQAGSITTGQSYLGAQQAQQQSQLLSHYESTRKAGSQSYIEKPETLQVQTRGDYTVQKREKESQLAEQRQSKLESETTTQIGNTQVERRRKVTEEFEHVQSAKTIEIRTGSHSVTERRQSYGKTGFVANQARRLSGLEQEITNLTSQSQAISARAANLTDTNFPQLRSPEPTSKFPLKPVLPPHDEPKAQSYMVSASADSKLAGPPPGFSKQQQVPPHEFSGFAASSISSLQQQQQQQKSLSAYSSSITTNTTSSLSSQANAANVSYNLTKASVTNNQASSASASYGVSAATSAATAIDTGAAAGGPVARASGICPVTGTFCRPGHTCCKQQLLQPLSAAGNTSYSSNNTYRPNASTELCTKPTNVNAKLSHKRGADTSPSNNDSNLSSDDCCPDTDSKADDPTAMLTESIGKINMGDKMNNFMAEAGKIISNMLEARLVNENILNNSSQQSSLRTTNSSPANFSRSPMVVRKRLDLEDFKDIDPTEPVSLQPVVTVLPQTQQQYATSTIKGQPIGDRNMPALTTDLPANHPMSKVLELCENINQMPVTEFAQTNQRRPPSPLASNHDKTGKHEESSSLPPAQTVVYRNKKESPSARQSRGGELSTHAIDRRSYIEPNAQSEKVLDGPVFSVSVKALGRPDESDSNTPLSPENEEVVSQLLKDGKRPICCQCNMEITKGPFITALGRIWCPDHFICVNGNCRRPLQDIGFVEEKGDLYCEYCFEKYLAPVCSKCGGKIKGDCLNAIGKQFHPECFTCAHCGKLFGNTPFFLEDGNAYCEADWNELFTTKCFACGFPVEAGDRWVEALNHNYHSQCFNCTYCKQNLEGQSFYNKGGRPFCKNHAR